VFRVKGRFTLPLLAAAIFSTLVSAPAMAAGPMIAVPSPDPKEGRALFVFKGCVVCHSVNGVGGLAGPPLDAVEEPRIIDPVGFAARMWRGSLAMAELQATEFGYQVELTGEEIADLAAFVATPDAQKGFSEDEIPELIRGWTVDEPFAEPELMPEESRQ
jgi:mono/diheme cytochrome c family protein